MEFDEKELRKEISYAIKNIHGIRHVRPPTHPSVPASLPPYFTSLSSSQSPLQGKLRLTDFAYRIAKTSILRSSALLNTNGISASEKIWDQIGDLLLHGTCFCDLSTILLIDNTAVSLQYNTLTLNSALGKIAVEISKSTTDISLNMLPHSLPLSV